MRDVTWRPRTRPRRRASLKLSGGGLLALVLLNGVVFWYHGDPLERLPADESPRAKGAEPSSEPEARAPAAASEPAATPELAATPEPVAAPQPAPSPQMATALAGSLNPAAATLASAVVASGTLPAQAPAPIGEGASLEVDPYNPLLALRHPGPVQRVERVVLAARQTAAAALRQAGLREHDIAGALNSLTQLVDFRRLRPGHEFKVRLDAKGELVSMDLLQGRLDQVRTEREGENWRATRIEIPIDTVVSEVSGRVESSLWVALVAEAGESAELVHQVVDVFAWEIDFYSQVFPGDTFRLLVEKKFAEGEPVGYGNVLAAEFVSAGEVHRAYMHLPSHEGGPGGEAAAAPAYYDETGRSMRKQLLKAPLKYGHVTSGFGKRRHPILGYTRAHNGTDYGVPTGTPVWSVGDGQVVRAGWHGGFGKLVEIRHANGWLSQYAHLSRIDVKVGQRVRQKQIIGAVGSTGMSTGPHLHYGLKKNGRYVNSLTQRFEPGKALTGAELAKFQERVAHLSAQIDGIHLAMADEHE